MQSGVALITGASRGIGRGVAVALAGAGYDIAAAATRVAPGAGVCEVQERVEAMGRRCAAIGGDIANLGDHPRMIEEAVDKLGSIDVLVNNAGVAPLERKDILECSPESYDRVMGVNLRGPYFFTQRVARHMIAHPNAERARCVIFITSVSSDTASPSRAEYCVSKAGLSMTAQNFAVRLAEYGINVYDVRPGITETDMAATVKTKYDRLIEEGLLLQPRWATPEEIGEAVVALANGSFRYATGGVFTLDGGLGVKRL